MFENTGTIAAGMEAALKAQGKSTKVLVFGGDGGTFDIGFQALSGMLECGPYEGDQSIAVARLAVQTGLFPIIELERGGLASLMLLRHIPLVTNYLKTQQRFRHLFVDDLRAKEELEHIQAIVDHNIEVYNLRGEVKDAFDSEGMDTVRRGGIRWA